MVNLATALPGMFKNASLDWGKVAASFKQGSDQLMRYADPHWQQGPTDPFWHDTAGHRAINQLEAMSYQYSLISVPLSQISTGLDTFYGNILGLKDQYDIEYSQKVPNTTILDQLKGAAENYDNNYADTLRTSVPNASDYGLDSARDDRQRVELDGDQIQARPDQINQLGADVRTTADDTKKHVDGLFTSSYDAATANHDWKVGKELTNCARAYNKVLDRLLDGTLTFGWKLRLIASGLDATSDHTAQLLKQVLDYPGHA